MVFLGSELSSFRFLLFSCCKVILEKYGFAYSKDLSVYCVFFQRLVFPELFVFFSVQNFLNEFSVPNYACKSFLGCLYFSLITFVQPKRNEPIKQSSKMNGELKSTAANFEIKFCCFQRFFLRQ